MVAWIVVLACFAFGFGLLLHPSGSFVLSPMEHAKRQAETRPHPVSQAVHGLAGAWEAAGNRGERPTRE